MTRMRSLLLLLVGALTFAGATTLAAPASAGPGCPAVEVVFARGTAETAPPIGITGISFGDQLRPRLAGRSEHIHGVNYPASDNFNDRAAFVRNVVVGIKAAQAQIQSIARNCPQTDIVVGGYSQGAVVATYAVADSIPIPARYHQYASQAPRPMPTEIASHVAAVVLFAPPSDRWIRDLGAPPMRVGAAYRGKTARYCIPGDNVCDGSPVGQPNGLHVLYSVNGMTAQAAEFATRRINR